MIVKDEEERLGGCLAALDGLVDEIVVYDTGSTDASREIARAAGARVLDGYCDDDFGRARNAALDACRGTWILHVDADEIVQADAARLRAFLTRPGTPDRLAVPIDNTGDDPDAIEFTHQAARLFRRLRGRWANRLHEQVVPRPGIVGLTEGSCPHLRIRHDGYQGRLVTERDKLARNIRAATLDLEQGSGDVSAREANLGRALAAAGRHAEAMPHLAAARTSGLERVRRLVLRHGAETLINLGQPRESLDWIDELRRTSSHRGIADYLEGLARLNLGQLGEATRLFDGVGELRDEDGFTLSMGWLHARHGLALAARGRWDEAVDALLAAVAQRGTAAQPVWALLAQAVAEANRGLDEAVAAVRNAELTTVLGQLLNSQPEAADAFAEALWARWPADPHLFAAAIRLAPALPLLRALEWAARLRAAGLAERCPLIKIATDEATEPIRRLSAACIAATTFGDADGPAAVAAIVADLPPGVIPVALTTAAQLAPELLSDVVLAAARTPDRCLVVADALLDLGAAAEAVAVARYGRELATDTASGEGCRTWLAAHADAAA